MVQLSLQVLGSYVFTAVTFLHHCTEQLTLSPPRCRHTNELRLLILSTIQINKLLKHKTGYCDCI